MSDDEQVDEVYMESGTNSGKEVTRNKNPGRMKDIEKILKIIKLLEMQETRRRVTGRK